MPRINQDGVQKLYVLIVTFFKVKPDAISVNFLDPATGGRIAIALADAKVGFCFEGDDPAPLEEVGWTVMKVFPKELDVLADFFGNFEEILGTYRYNTTAGGLKSTSKHEEILLKALMAVGLPSPDRNLSLKRNDGKELTVPDFAWEDVKLAVFVDGVYFHLEQGAKKQLKEIAQDKKAQKEIFEKTKHRYENDKRIRNEMTSRGWTVLSFTDKELEQKDGVKSAADLVRSNYTRLATSQ